MVDVFGYSAALPQIIRQAGCEFFLTQKLSWSQFNAFPYHTFRWRGIDGSEVLTHFPPENNYNAWAMPSELVPAQDRFSEADRCPEFLSLFGLGDGGGPSENHLERAMRLYDLEGCPKLRFGKAEAFFDRIAPLADRLPEWEGELYLEMHRGTLTTQARTKRNNRRLEQLLVTAEFVAAALPPEAYPHAALDAAWKKLLINQFHDIIPGSSIREVYEVTEREHIEAIAECRRLIEQAAEQLFTPDKDAILAINTLSDRWHGVIEAPAEWIGCSVLDEAGNVLPTQVEDGRLQILATLPGSSFQTLRRGPATEATPVVHDVNPVLENELIRYEFNASGELVSAYDKEWKRELIPAGTTGNRFLLYVDRPNQYDAWDVDVFYPEEKQQSPSAAAVSGVTCGPVKSGLTVNLTIGESTLVQHVSLRAGSRRLDFATRADWRENHKLLRVEFPAAVDASEGNYEILGHLSLNPNHSPFL